MPSLPINSEDALHKIPNEIQLSLFDPHFRGSSGGGGGEKIDTRVPSELARSMDITLQAVTQAGGLSWCQTRSDIMRMGAFVMISILSMGLANPPPQLQTYLAVERIEASAKAQASLNEKMRETIRLRSAQVSEMFDQPGGQDAVRQLLEDMKAQIMSIPEGYWRATFIRWVKNDLVLSGSMIRLGFALEDSNDEAPH